MSSQKDLVEIPKPLWDLAITVIDEATSTELFKYMPVTEFSFTRLYDKVTIRASFDLMTLEDLTILDKYVTVLLPKSKGIVKEKLNKSKQYICDHYVND